MLDTITKKRIDDCRDILVGKLPDPKSQIEQITIALIYKFMDDMDKESIELGGEAKFFSGDFEKYSWDNLFDTRVSAQEMLKLYSESIESMEKNPKIPQLFRDIFKNAYLPYRDPETLKLFLKTISEFEYTHSEKLGDAFEYLLSVMGSQGDAGQFRTPRHIIDFLVKIINPTKDETVLDPACGTAGFLISAFKHIQDNTQLTPDDRAKLIKNFVGYDISPEMVKLSLVNLYLHGFLAPHIHEYDTLTSEERWDESFDVVLANPPFMSPKGGIRPHKRFSVTSNRSEVLFVDYIAEHLNPKGRAGIIVPEGVIFQSGNAYKELRKMLVENYLYAVISLPSGVFNPYSGVKTSILVMDKTLAKQSDKILFVKIENDGYSLGSQRGDVKGSQLGEAIDVLNYFKDSIINQTTFENTPLAHAVEKIKIAESGEYNLSGEKYKDILITQSNYKFVSLLDENIFKVVSGGTPSTNIEEYWNGNINWATLKDLPAKEFISKINSTERKITEDGLKNSSANILPPNSILVSTRATIGRIAINKVECSTNQGFKNIIINDLNIVNPYFVALMMTKLVDKMNSLATGGTFKEVSTTNFKTLEFPLPPLSIQEEIVNEIEVYQKIIDGAKMVVENYKPQIDINPDWEIIELEKVCELNPKKSELNSLSNNLEVSFVPMADLNENNIDFEPKEIKLLSEVIKGYTYFSENDVLLAKVTPCFENGKAGIAKNLKNRIGFGSSEYYVLRPKDKILSAWIYLNITTNGFRESGKLNMTGTGGLKRVPKDFISKTMIPLPEIDIQQQIVDQIEKEIALVEANKELIKIYEQKIKDKISRVWSK